MPGSVGPAAIVTCDAVCIEKGVCFSTDVYLAPHLPFAAVISGLYLGGLIFDKILNVYGAVSPISLSLEVSSPHRDPVFPVLVTHGKKVHLYVWRGLSEKPVLFVVSNRPTFSRHRVYASAGCGAFHRLLQVFLDR